MNNIANSALEVLFFAMIRYINWHLHYIYKDGCWWRFSESLSSHCWAITSKNK